MPAPVLIQHEESSFFSLSPRPITAVDGFEGDVLVAYAIVEDTENSVAVSNDGAALTWTLGEELTTASYAYVGVWTTVLTEDRPALGVVLTRQGAAAWPYTGGVVVFRSSDGVGATAQNHANSGAPSCSITTTGDMSAVFVVSADWNWIEGDTRAWRTTAGSLVELSYFFNSTDVTYYVGYHPETGVAAAQTVGLTDPTGQKYSIAAVEVWAGIPRDVVPGELIHMKAR